MGVIEWVGLLFPTLAVIGHMIKVYSDQQITNKNVSDLNQWKKEMELNPCVSLADYTNRRQDCRSEIYKDFNRLEQRFEKFIESLTQNEAERKRENEETRKEIREMRDHVIRVITLLEGNK